MIYSLPAIVLTPGGSSTHLHMNNTTYTEQHNETQCLEWNIYIHNNKNT